MKTIILTILSMAATICAAQNFQGKAIYKTHSKVKVTVKGNDALQKQIEAQMRKKSQKTYTLYFNTKASVYKQEAQLTKPESNSSGINISVGEGKEVLYKNIQEKNYTQQKDFFGKTFLISDSLKMPKWEMLDEQKGIGSYNCYKAIWKQERTVDKLDKETGKFKPVLDTLITSVWYTPEIPVSNGPEMLCGLPGLILEVQRGKLTIACSEVVLNTDEKIQIAAPQKGKKVNHKEFEDIKTKKIEEMNKRYKNKRKGDDKNTISITIEK